LAHASATGRDVFPRLRRCAYRACYLVFIVTGRAAARLAADFRTLGTAANRFGPLPILLQLPILACWLLVRPISIAAFAACSSLAPVRRATSRAPSA
jgi:hypothetical protein